MIGPPLVEAVRELGRADWDGGAQSIRWPAIAMAVAYGESLTNLLQPFYLLIILPIMGVGIRIQARDIVGYFFVPFLLLFTIIGLLVTFLPL